MRVGQVAECIGRLFLDSSGRKSVECGLISKDGCRCHCHGHGHSHSHGVCAPSRGYVRWFQMDVGISLSCCGDNECVGGREMEVRTDKY